MKFGFIGFGGAGYGLAKGLRETEGTEIYFFDPLWEISPQDDVIKSRAKETGAFLKKSIADVIKEAEIIISCVTGSVAFSVAEQAAPFLEKGQLFVDVNTASPETMDSLGTAIQLTGAAFVDVAMMGAVPTFLHRVPSLVSGDGAELFMTRMQPYDMDLTWVGAKAGQASAIKMFRSIFMKGFLALLMEMLPATHKYQVDSVVLESLAKTMEKNDFLETVRLQMAKGVISSDRMSHEMSAVIDTLTEMGLPAVMATATREKLQWCSRLKLVEEFGGEMPNSLNEILEVMAAKNT